MYTRIQIVLLRTTDVKRKQDGRYEMYSYQNVRLPQLLQRCASMAVQCSDVTRISHGGGFFFYYMLEQFILSVPITKS